MKFKDIFRSIYNIGNSSLLTNKKSQQVKLTNQITIIMVVSALPYLFIFHLFNLHLAGNMVLIVLSLYSSIFYLNHKQHIHLATFLVMGIQSVMIVPFFSIYLGFQSGAHLMFVPLSILPLILYPGDSEKYFRYLGFNIILLSLFTTLSIHLMMPDLAGELPSSSTKIIYMFAFLTTFGLVLPQVNVFNRSEQKAAKKLEGTNLKLNKALIKLRESTETQRHLSQYADYAKLVQRIAHEFKNPLQMLQGTAELGIQKQSSPEKIFKVILETVDRLNRVIQPMLNYLNSSQKYTLKPFNILDTLDDIILLSKANLRARQITLEFKNDLNNTCVYGDSNAIGQVLINLISNAIDAIGHLGGKITIHLMNDEFISKNESMSGIKISIVDNGCGMNEEDLKSIFVPYQTSKTTSTNVGLGLSIVYKIIQDHKGLIKINSALGEGTTVSVWFQLGDEIGSNEKSDDAMFVLANEFFE